MRRVVSLFLPTWSTDRLRRKTGKPQPDGAAPPLVTALPDHGRRVVAAVDTDARKLGIVPGMTITKARMLAPELAVVDADPEDDLEGLRRLALWAGRRYSPQCALDPPNGLWVDVTGCATLFGGERPLVRDLHRRITASGMAVQIALADTPGCAHAVARHVPAGRPVIIEPGKSGAAIMLMPVAALRIESSVAMELKRMGFARVEQLIGEPRAPLVKRFGKQLYRRLDQALGHVPEPIEPIFPPRVPRARRGLLEPIATEEAFATVIADLVTDLVGQLVADGTGARRLDLFFERVDGQHQAIRVGTAAPTREARHLAKLLCAKIDTIEPGLGVEAMTLVAPLVELLNPVQAVGVATGGSGVPDLPALIDALANRFGARKLYRISPTSSTMPEREIGVVPALAKPSGAGWADDLPRPSRMIVPPEAVEVTAMLPDHPPAMFVWRGKRYRVAQADGPERLHGEWWRHAGHEADMLYAMRDYFQIETVGGGRYWLFRLGDGEHVATGPMRWFIHGAFA